MTTKELESIINKAEASGAEVQAVLKPNPTTPARIARKVKREEGKLSFNGFVRLVKGDNGRSLEAFTVKKIDRIIVT